MTPKQEERWSQRGQNGRQYVILVDSNSEVDTPHSPINVMKNILTKVCELLNNIIIMYMFM